jgi:leucyl-tRNA synthetase
MQYQFRDIETKWQNYWDENSSFEPQNDRVKKKKIYIEYVSISKWKNTYGTC